MQDYKKSALIRRLLFEMRDELEELFLFELEAKVMDECQNVILKKLKKFADEVDVVIILTGINKDITVNIRWKEGHALIATLDIKSSVLK